MAEVFIATPISRMTVSTVGIVAYDEYLPQHHVIFHLGHDETKRCVKENAVLPKLFFDSLVLLQLRGYTSIFSTILSIKSLSNRLFLHVFSSPDLITKILDTTSGL